MTYRIITDGQVFKVQVRAWPFWDTIVEYTGQGYSVRHRIFTLEGAKQYIHRRESPSPKWVEVKDAA